ncbi:hypothetical protein [Nocardia bovistercoris]|uniref:Uncharacterized protein n=1 Tax=Nocardia bovistercoris TaxID=2785916 RepID=A0A931IB10_9NOCA|nr:hypothetical protein [Nocardia bovistercoris]MBH0778059.1 hypothetical protein [Nocardia bovistercoris]
MAAEPLLRITPSAVRFRPVPLLTLLLVVLIGVAVAVVFRPAEPPIVIRGKMGSKVDFFRDQEVQKILLRNRFDVRVDDSGSRDVAVHDIESYDFVFPSGQPAADLIMAERQDNKKDVQSYLLFSSPIVLATYRPYAQALSAAGVAEPVPRGAAETLYYRVDIGKFVELTEQGTSWDQIDIRRYGPGSSNVVLAHTPDVCASNSGGTYQAMVAYAKYGQRFTTSNEKQVIEFAETPRRIYEAQGAPTADRMPYYLSAEGKSIAPVVVIYEHQYLAYQLSRPPGRPDRERVLLYPRAHFETQPRLLALNDKGRKLAQFLQTDPEVRRRAVQLGFRMLDRNPGTVSSQLNELLVGRGLDVPAADDGTYVSLPRFDVFDKFIVEVGGCPR